MDSLWSIIYPLIPLFLVLTFVVPPLLIFLPGKTSGAATITFQQREQHARNAVRYAWATAALALILYLLSPISPYFAPVVKGYHAPYSGMSEQSNSIWTQTLCYFCMLFSAVKGMNHSRITGWFSYRYFLLQRLFALGGYGCYLLTSLHWFFSDLHGPG